ncbi:MAG TPA: ATP-binding protein, partial [Bacteroidales bacterium]|nr:ATP-binding protein [Bacteroidales bacterium]
DLEIISKEIDRMEAFIRNFLKFAKPAEPTFEIIDPVEVLHEVIQLVKPNLKKNQIELEFRQVAERYKVSGDSSQLKQVFMNLIINAIEVMPNGGKLIFTIRPYQNTELASIENQTRYLSVNIEDFGPGIPEKVMKNLFEPFIKGSVQGVGLGLSISQNIASMHRGWIEGINKPDGQGAIFSVFIPIVAEN